MANVYDSIVFQHTLMAALLLARLLQGCVGGGSTPLTQPLIMRVVLAIINTHVIDTALPNIESICVPT